MNPMILTMLKSLGIDPVAVEKNMQEFFVNSKKSSKELNDRLKAIDDKLEILINASPAFRKKEEPPHETSQLQLSGPERVSGR